MSFAVLIGFNGEGEADVNRYFAAVAGDAPSWECWPPKDWALVSFLLVLEHCSELILIA